MEVKEKDAYYFSHDSNARNDLKIKALVKKYGWSGYGYYWVIIENLRESDNYKLPFKDYVLDALAEEFNVSSTDVQQFIDDCINKYDLLEKEDGCFYSNSLKRRMKIKDNKREQARQAGLVSAQKRTQQQRPFNNRSTTVQQGKERKGKEGKESKKNNDISDIVYCEIPKKINCSRVRKAFNEYCHMRWHKDKKELEIYTQERLMKTLLELSNGNTEIAVEVCNRATDGAWANFYELKNDDKSKQQKLIECPNRHINAYKTLKDKSLQCKVCGAQWKVEK